MQEVVLRLRGADFGNLAQKGQIFLSRLMVSFRVHSLLFAIVALYLVAAYFVRQQAGSSVDLRPLAVMQGLVTLVIPLMFLGVVVMRFYHVAVNVRPEHPLSYLLKDIGAYLSKPARLLNAIPATIALIYFIECFTSIKSAIPFVNPFSWDLTLMELDRAVHFGVDPWRLLQPLLGYWWVTLFINLVYNLWFFVIWFVMVALAFADRQSELRLQYFVAFFLTWSIGGSLLAIVFSSAGPVYFGKLGLGTDPYAPLLNYLHQTNNYVHLWAVNTQNMLWEAYTNDNKALISGISAMPSMHNTTAALIALLGWRVSRIAGIAGTLFAVMILVGSIHLGWHYALDGYAGIGLAVGIWYFSGILVRWYMALPFIARDIETLHDV